MQQAFDDLHLLWQFARNYELLHSPEYKAAVSEYCADMMHQRIHNEMQVHMAADLTHQFQSSRSRFPVDVQKINNQSVSPALPSLAYQAPLSVHSDPLPSVIQDHHLYPCQEDQMMAELACQRVIREGAHSKTEVLKRCRAYQRYLERLEYVGSRVQWLEKDNAQIDFSQMKSQLPDGFTRLFKKRGLFEWAFTDYVAKSTYQDAFYKTLLDACGENVTREQLIQQQYAQMHQWSQYCYSGFLAFIQSFALYDQYVFELNKHLKKCTKCCKGVHDCAPKAYHTIAHEAVRIQKKLDAAAKREAEKKAQAVRAYNNLQRNRCMQDVFNGQALNLDVLVLQWQESNPERAQAYEQAIHDPDTAIRRQYAISQKVSDCLADKGLIVGDYKNCTGNALQQELFQELINGIEDFAQLPELEDEIPFDVIIRNTTLDAFEHARQANGMGDCVGASKLIDLCGVFLEYSVAVASGLGTGLARGIVDGIQGTYHVVRHPLDTAAAFGHVVCAVAELIGDFVPFGPADDFLALDYSFTGRCDDSQEYERVAKNWANAHKSFQNAHVALQKWWKKTPGPDKLHQMTRGSTQFITSVYVGNVCFGLLGQAIEIAGVEALALCKRAKPQVAAAGEAMTGMQGATTVLNEAEKVTQTPATKLIEDIGKVQSVRKTCPTDIKEFWHKTAESIEKAIAKIMPKELDREHIFASKHKFDKLIEHCGGTKESTVRAMLEAVSGKIPADGVFQNIPIQIGDWPLFICGRVMDGIPLISTCFSRLI
ncbi:MAG TPA: hypothetical protein VGT41_05025 [Candidatus Babeliales bacterium]|nr:hypothetical protein [Candidatus Babeliales bacterium]